MNKALALTALLLSACATPSPSNNAAIGSTLFYTRSNHDGSMAERIVMHRQSAQRMIVNKMVDPCTNAAYVTADFNANSGEAVRLVGGRLTRSLEQDAFATLELDMPTATLSTRVVLPDGVIEEELADVRPPWRLYDFDLADVNAALQGRPAPTRDFYFMVVLAWPEAGAPRFVTNRGRAEVVHVGAEEHSGHATQKYDVSGSLNGTLWLDAANGHVVEARFDEPNHPGYDNFSLVLTREAEAPQGDAAWREAMAAHWRDCPTL